MAILQEPSLKTIHWTEVRIFNIKPSPAMLASGGEVLKITCLLRSESPRTVEAGKVRLVVFDRSYIVYRLRGVLNGFLGAVEQTDLVDLLAEVLKP